MSAANSGANGGADGVANANAASVTSPKLSTTERVTKSKPTYFSCLVFLMVRLRTRLVKDKAGSFFVHFAKNSGRTKTQVFDKTQVTKLQKHTSTAKHKFLN